MNKHHLHTTLRQFRCSFLAHFRRVTEQDLRLILAGPSELLLTVLQMRYGYSRAQAKDAWNDFVLRAIDGHSLDPASTWALPYDEECAPRQGEHARLLRTWQAPAQRMH